MEKELEIFDSELPYISPANKEQVRGNEHHMASILTKAKNKEMKLKFCVLFLIHRCIKPDLEDYDNVGIFFNGDLYTSWGIVYIKGEHFLPKNILGLVLYVPKKNLSSEEFKVLEAHYKCKASEDRIKVIISLSKIRSVRFEK